MEAPRDYCVDEKIARLRNDEAPTLRIANSPIGFSMVRAIS
jgi:hypothetical protein